MIRHLLLFFSGCLFFYLQADPVKNKPYTLSLPNNQKLECFISGDEFYRYLHDANGYPITEGRDKYFYYALTDAQGHLTPTTYRVNSIAPHTIPNLSNHPPVSSEAYQAIRDHSQLSTHDLRSAPLQRDETYYVGEMNTLVIFIRLKDDPDFMLTNTDLHNLFNAPSTTSLRRFFLENSYQKLDLRSHFLPPPEAEKITYYQDIYDRSHYRTATDDAAKEHSLLERAVRYINNNTPITSDIELDKDNDGNCDNVIFILSGQSEAWGNLLWPHAWTLYSRNVTIRTKSGDKRIYNYSLAFDNSEILTHCHETFHTFGTPDFYRYENIYPYGDAVNGWEPMAGGMGLSLTHNRWKYQKGQWVDQIPQITHSGTYTLNATSQPSHNCYKIQSPYDPQTYFMLEYRQKKGPIEGTIPGSGLIIYRVDTRYEATQAGSYKDPLYLYRPGGDMGNNGTYYLAHFSQTEGRTAINDATNPASFLQNGHYGGLNIYNIGPATADSAQITFDVRIIQPQDTIILPFSAPQPITLTNIATQANLTYDTQTEFFTAKKKETPTPTHHHTTFTLHPSQDRYHFHLTLPHDPTQAIAPDPTNPEILTLRPYSTTDKHQQWEICQANPNTLYIRNTADPTSGLITSLSINSYVDHGKIQKENPFHQWKINPAASTPPAGPNPSIINGALYSIENQRNNLFIQPSEETNRSGEPLLLRPHNNKPQYQTWQLTLTNDQTAYIIQSPHTGKVLSTNSLTTQGMQLFQTDNQAQTNQTQQWEILTLPDNTYQIRNRATQYVLDNANRTTDKAPLIQTNAQTGNTNQSWRLNLLESPNTVRNPQLQQGTLHWTTTALPTAATAETTTLGNPLDGTYYTISHTLPYTFRTSQELNQHLQTGIYQLTAHVRSNGNIRLFAQHTAQPETKITVQLPQTGRIDPFKKVQLHFPLLKDSITIGFEGNDLTPNNWLHFDNISFSLISLDLTTQTNPITPSTVAPHSVSNLPNPLTDQTHIAYTLTKEADMVQLIIYHPSGHKIIQQNHLPQTIGTHHYPFTPHLPTGIYPYQLLIRQNGQTEQRTSKMIIL